MDAKKIAYLKAACVDAVTKEVPVLESDSGIPEFMLPKVGPPTINKVAVFLTNVFVKASDDWDAKNG